MRKIGVLLGAAALFVSLALILSGGDQKRSHRSAGSTEREDKAFPQSESGKRSQDAAAEVGTRKRVAGVITDATTGNPVRNALVEFLPIPSWETQEAGCGLRVFTRTWATAPTDADGRFEARVPEGWCQIRASAKGYDTNAKDGNAGGTHEYEIKLELYPKGSATVTVVDSHRRPVAGAQVLLFGYGESEHPIGEARTPGSGRLSIPSGTQRVLVRKPGYAALRFALRDLQPEPIVLTPGYRCAGVVVDDRGAPVEGAKILARPGFDEEWITQSTREGRFTLDGLPGELFELVAFHRDHPDLTAPVSPGDTRLRLTFPSYGRLTGRVVAPEGPGAGAEIRVWSRTRSGETTTTDAAGRFELRAAPGTYTVSARRGSLRAQAKVRVQSGSRISGLDLHLKPYSRGPSHLITRVEFADGEPAQGARIYVLDEEPSIPAYLRRSHSEAATNDAGRARIHGGTRGPGEELDLLVLWKEAEIVRSARYRGIAVDPSDRTEARIRFPVDPTFELRLLDEEGKVVPKARIAKIRSDPGLWIIRRTATGARMAFHPALGPYDMELYVPGRERRRIFPMEPPRTDRPFDVVLRKEARAAGRVDRDRAKGRPTLALEFEGVPRTWFAQPDETGRFFFKNLPPGEGQLTLRDRPRAAVFLRNVQLTPGETTELGRISIPERSHTEVLVADGEGRPLGGAHVYVWYRRSDVSPWTRPVFTRHDGRATVVVNGGARPFLYVRKPGWGRRFVPVRDPGKAHRVVLRRGATLRLLVRHAPRVTPPRTLLRLPDAPFELGAGGGGQKTANGTERIYKDLPEGRVVVHLGDHRIPVAVRSGRVATAEVALH